MPVCLEIRVCTLLHVCLDVMIDTVLLPACLDIIICTVAIFNVCVCGFGNLHSVAACVIGNEILHCCSMCVWML